MEKSFKKYNFQDIEGKWQKIWEDKKIFEAQSPAISNKETRPKYYVLVEFPYASGEGLHVGHCRSYIGLDVVARKKRMHSFNVLFPIGWDSFGLPTENYAIKVGVHPAIVTKKNTTNFKKQLKRIGLSFDWSREIDTSSPEYFKWTQWIFIQLFKQGLAYKAKIPVNWCPSCKIVLANEEVVSGNCERCGSQVVKKEKEQWLIKITNYAERLLEDLSLVDYPARVKTAQQEWIGKSEGWEIEFRIQNSNSENTGTKLKIPVFTTRVDTLFGATYLVLAPEHRIIQEMKDKILNFKQVQEYIDKASQKSELERLTEAKDKTGIELLGVKAVNPINNIKIPIFVAEYVMASYGSGAIMAVPAHDKRDFEFAKQHNLPIVPVVKPLDKEIKPDVSQFFNGEGILINSDKFSGLETGKAKDVMGRFLEKNKFGKKAQYFKLRDWVFSRQRYWGEPIPMVFCKKCASIRKSEIAGWSPLKESELPLLLPDIKEYKPTESGESPLAQNKEWVKAICPKCGEEARRETDVMPNWAGSNWYYLAYLMQGISNFQFPISKYQEIFKYWLEPAGKNSKEVGGVDWYNGGMEHATLHLLYSRFIFKFLWDIGAVPKTLGTEPYKKRTSHGMVLGEGGIKMSKSKGNVVNPIDIIEQYGADVFRVFKMFMGPFQDAIPWDSKGLVGAERFLEKVWGLQQKIEKNSSNNKNQPLAVMLNQAVQKIDQDIDELKFNTAISTLMVVVNEMEKADKINASQYLVLLILLNPFALHITEEIWHNLGQKGFCCLQKWPKYKEGLGKKEKISFIIQVNGKTRDIIKVVPSISEKKAKELALSQEKIKKWLADKKIKNIIFVKGKLINIVV